MLTSLSIKNFALIEHLQIDFTDGFSIITGETGAGKSILLGALALVLGKRADLTSLKDKEKKCIIEASFNIKNYNLEWFFTENDLDYETITIIRREILPSGKSRAFINDSPVNLPELQNLAEFLIDIHSQQQTRELSEESYQAQILDAIAGNNSLITEYKAALKQLKTVKTNLKNLHQQKEALLKEQDYNAFLLQELIDAGLREGEQKELELFQEKLSNVEAIAEAFSKTLSISNEEQIGVIRSLNEIKVTLQKIAPLSDEYTSVYERISSLIIEFEDIVSEVENESDKLISDPEQLQSVNQKLQLIYTLQKKHQAATVEELITVKNELIDKVDFAGNLEENILKAEQQTNAAITKTNGLAEEIYNNRRKASPVFFDELTKILSDLGMPDARFELQIDHTENYYDNGKDSINLLFSANKGIGFGLLKKVASGGEMSRIMLSAKAVLANYSKLPTIIFDEIDTGVSGEIAHKIGDIMKQMGNKMQVFAITHLPQIAAKGAQHYKVSKYTQGDTTISELALLTDEERITEVAHMLSGKDITEAALNHAKQLLN